MDYRVERVLSAGRDATRLRELRPWFSRFFHHTNFDHVPSGDTSAVVVLERWTRRDGTTSAVEPYFSERGAGQWLIATDARSQRAFVNRHVVVLPGAPPVRLEMFADAPGRAPTDPMAWLPEVARPLRLQIPLQGISGTAEVRAWLELWNGEASVRGSIQEIIQSGTGRAVEVTVTPPFVATGFRVGLELSNPGTSPAVLQVKPIDLR